MTLKIIRPAPICPRRSLKWLTQEADAKNLPSPKHVQPEEGRKEPAPRAIKFRKGCCDVRVVES